jgi:hypothetical protein
MKRAALARGPEKESLYMKNFTSQSKDASSEKRNPGAVFVRRGILEHWPAMSVNARAFYIWLLLKAFWLGPKRGLVEASFDDMARGNGWSLKTLQRTIEELEAKPYIEVERAANQYGLTRIRILKYDLEQSTSAVDKSDRSSTVGPVSAVDSGVDSAAVEFVQSKPVSLQNQQDLHAPKKVKEVKNEKEDELDAVRRPVDAELRITSRTSFSPSEKRKKLEKRLAEKILKNNNAHELELDEDEREAFAYIQYKLKDPRNVTGGFVWTVFDVYDDHKDELPSSGNLSSKIIDSLMAEQESCKKLAADPSEYYWPPDFQDHRDRLRERERIHERTRAAAAEARA